jgi:hypothetical protein
LNSESSTDVFLEAGVGSVIPVLVVAHSFNSDVNEPLTLSDRVV